MLDVTSLGGVVYRQNAAVDAALAAQAASAAASGKSTTKDVVSINPALAAGNLTAQSGDRFGISDLAAATGTGVQRYRVALSDQSGTARLLLRARLRMLTDGRSA